MHRKNLFSPEKMKYVTGRDRPKVDCILCSVAGGDEKVRSLEIARTKNFVISVNLYPFNAGHLLIFPIKHVLDFKGLSKSAVVEMHELASFSMDALSELYNPGGFNVGFNIGDCSGASIAHLHMHIVPRYNREIGFLDIVSGARLIVEAPDVTMERLKEVFKKRKMR